VLGRPVTLDDLPDALLDEAASRGFDWIWPLGVWRTGPAARAVSLARADWRAAFQKDLPDLRDKDASGSPFAIEAHETKRSTGAKPPWPAFAPVWRGAACRCRSDAPTDAEAGCSTPGAKWIAAEARHDGA
jgi:hypothetical protein